MNLLQRSNARRVQQGSVAVEAACCMAFILLPLFAFIYTLGNFFWYYTAAQKAVHDAALYMAGAPLAEVKINAADALAAEIMQQETADIRPTAKVSPTVDCGYTAPNSTFVVYRDCYDQVAPAAVQTTLSLTVPQPFFTSLVGNKEISILLFSQMPYVGK